MTRPDDVPEDVWAAAGLCLVGRPHLELTDQLWIAKAILAERERAAKVADEIAAGRSRQCSAAKTAKKRIEARDFESMAMSAIEVSYAIRAGATP